jgi:hypothetical protein
MGRILIHAGMPKAASASIQRWVARRSSALRDERDVQVLVASDVDGAEGRSRLALQAHRGGSVNSPLVPRRYLVLKRSAGFLDRMLGQLASFAESHECVLLSSEDLGYLFADLDMQFIEKLEDLARTHPTDVAYYVRPQHEAIRSTWQQSGFRREQGPTSFFTTQAARLHHIETLAAVERAAPSLGFRIRPCRSDLLHRRSPVADFARTFLDMDVDEDDCSIWVNRSLPIALVNLLRVGPEDLRKPQAREALRSVMSDAELPGASRLQRAEKLIHRQCHEMFEPGNRRLIERYGWSAPYFIPPCDDEVAGDIAELDRLWDPEASPDERAVLYAALARVVNA